MDRAVSRRLVRIAQGELRRAMSEMRVPGFPRPYFISYLIRDEERWNVKAKFGIASLNATAVFQDGDVEYGGAGLSDIDIEAWAALIRLWFNFGKLRVGFYGHFFSGDDDTTSATLASLEMQSDMFATEEQTLIALQVQSQTAAGRMQASQAGNLIAAQQVRQLQKLRQLQMAQMQMQAVYMARELDQQAAQQAARDRFMQSGRKPIIGDEKRY